MEAAKRSDIILPLLHDAVDREVLAANPDLRAVASMAVTPDRIDVAEATARRIAVTTVPPVAADAAADIAFGLMLAVARRIAEADRVIRSGVFPGSQSCHLVGAGVSGKTLGLVGCGGVGQAVARRARGFDMRVIYCDPRRLSDEDEARLGVTAAGFEEVLGQSDFVSLHAPLNDETCRMLGERQFALMRRTAFLVNTAHGGIVDEAALARALAEGRIAGAALDAFENEPRIERPLLTMSNVVLTPHLGGAVAELREAMAHVVVDNIAAVIEGRVPPNCVNREVFAS